MRTQHFTPDYILDHSQDGIPCVAIPNWLFKDSYSNLSIDAKLVYALLLPPFHHSEIGETIIQSNPDELINTVKYMLACRKRTAMKVLSELLNANLVTMVAA